MNGRMKNLFSLNIFSSSTFVFLYLLFLDHKHFSLSIRIDNEDNIRKPANRIINISRGSCHGSGSSRSLDQLMLHILKNYSEARHEDKKDEKAFLSLNLEGQTRLERTRIRNKRGFESVSSEDVSNSVPILRLERSMSSRQQKLGPIFYQEPPSIYHFSNDTGRLGINMCFIYNTFTHFNFKYLNTKLA